MTTGEIYEINGPVVKVRDVKGFSMMETVKVGNAGLIGEVIGINGRDTVIQVYEPTSGIKPGEPVIGEGMPLSVLLGPGIIGNIFDGIERPVGQHTVRRTAAESLPGPDHGPGHTSHFAR